MQPPPSTSPPAIGTTLLHDRRLMGLLIAGGLIMLIALTLLRFSGAYFTSTSRSPGNEFAAGGMSLKLSDTGQVVDGGQMRPGDVRSGRQTVTNTGHRGALFLVVDDLEPGNRLARVLRIRVQQVSPYRPTVLYDGALTQLSRLQLATLSTAEERTWELTVTWPESASSEALEGSRTALAFEWRMESTP